MLYDAETSNDGVASQQQRSYDDRTTSCSLTASGTFGDYVMLTTSSSVVVLDGRQLTTQCDWHDVSQAGASVWIEPLRL